MALDLGTLVGFLDLDAAKFEKKLSGAGGKVADFAKKMGKAAAVGAGAAAAAVGAFAVKSLNDFGNFQAGMNEVFTLMPGVTKDAMGKMSDDTRTFVKEMGVAHEEAVPALYSALSAGVPPGNVFDFMEVGAKAAKGGVTDLNTAVDGITSVVNAYGDTLKGAGEASDLMFTAVRLGKTSFEELSASLFQVNPTAAALGVGFEDVTAALATMTAQGVPTAVATTQLRSAFVELSQDGGKTADLFKKLSGKTFKKFIASGGNTQDALQLLEKHAKKTGVGVNDLFGSVEAGGAALSLTGRNTESFDNSIKEMAASAGATDAAYAQMDTGLNRSFERIKIGVKDAALGFGESLSPAVEDAAAWVGEVLPGALEDAGKEIQSVVDFLSEEIPNAVDSTKAAIEKAIAFFQEWGDEIGLAAGVITAILLPALVRAGVGALASAGKQVLAWALARGGAVKTAAAYVIQSYVIIGRWVAMGVAAIVSGAQTAYIWLLYRLDALKTAGLMVVQAAKIVAQWVVMSVGATVNAIKMAAAWVAGITVPAAAAIGTLVATVARYVAQWVIMGVQSGIQAIIMAAAWVVGVGIPAVAAGITMGIQAAVVIGAWLLMAVQATAQAVRMAAAWFIALGPIGWVIGAIIGLVALVILNWEKVSTFTSEAWANITRFISEAWTNITTGVSDGIGQLVEFFTGIPGKLLGALGDLGGLLLGAGGQIMDGFLNGLTSGFNAVKDFVGGIGSWIADHKGPKRYDLGLLVPAGGWIMAGLGTGIEKSMPTLQSQLRGVSGAIQSGINPTLKGGGQYDYSGRAAVPSAGGGSTITNHITVTEASNAEETAQIVESRLNQKFADQGVSLGR